VARPFLVIFGCRAGSHTREPRECVPLTWHHAAIECGGSSNFAGTFPIWDVAFGTFYMPENELPDAYGIADKSFPEGFGAQMLYPFTR
jgi:sterol desaturase/sphingolipid hydroxylase (fatty acid hydroxylase superfamily)